MPAPSEQHPNKGSAAAANDMVSGAYSYIERFLDWLVPRRARQRAYENMSAFASARPILFSFLVSQALLLFLPLLLFATFSVSCVAFALGAAVVFSLFWIGIALLALVPTLLVTCSIAVLLWVWCVGSFVVARWLYCHAPFGVNAGVEVDVAGNKVSAVEDDEGFDASIRDKNKKENDAY